MNAESEHVGTGRIKKHDRVLEIYRRLTAGQIVRKMSLADEYGVDPRSIQRDIDTLRDFLADSTLKNGSRTELIYDHREKGFRLTNLYSTTLTNAELFAVSKILLDSRSLGESEAKQIIKKLVNAGLPDAEKKKMYDLVSNEQFHYVAPRHGKNLVDTIWELADAVYAHKKMDLTYRKSNGEVTTKWVKPVGIMCSEYYFYLIAYIEDMDQKHPDCPTIYRVDRIEDYRIREEKFHVPYQKRFEEGEFRKRIPFMYGGSLNRVEFIYRGPDLNAVLDRLPSAEYQTLPDGTYRITVEVYGRHGIEMWLGSQGDMVERI